MAIMTRQSALAVLFAAAALATAAAHAQQHEEARVVSSIPAPGGGYNVTYEYAGRTYTTRTDSPPGRTIPIQVSAIGVTTSPVYEPTLAPNGLGQARPEWENVTPEPGVVVSGAAPAPVYGAPPVYAPAPPPVYVQPGYYPAPIYYPPVGVSLNLGYSRGWGGGWRHGHHWR